MFIFCFFNNVFYPIKKKLYHLKHLKFFCDAYDLDQCTILSCSKAHLKTPYLTYFCLLQMNALRTIPYQEWTGGSNTRPVMPLNHRTVRTNINVHKTVGISKSFSYQNK